MVREEKSVVSKRTKKSILDRGIPAIIVLRVQIYKYNVENVGEVEASVGMSWRMSGDQVQLAWRTGEETNNLGYIITKRPSYGGEFEEIASYKDVSSLATKGPSGGRYGK